MDTKLPPPDRSAAEPSQSMQRVKVAMTGLASVLVLIGLASAVFNATRDEPGVTAIGASKPETVANIADLAVDNATANEPLAELGVAPSAAADNSATPARK